MSETIGLSTSWNSFRLDSAEKIFFEIRQAGFKRLELSFNLTAKMVRELTLLCRRNSSKIISLHNFCPIPPAIKRNQAMPDCLSLASLDEAERLKAIKFTQRTIATAESVGAKAVVLHCGRVEIPDRTRDLIRLYCAGEVAKREFSALKQQCVSQRRKLSRQFFQKVLKSLDKLNSYAQKKGVLLGIETRYYYREIPTFSETAVILDKFKGSSITYWHDTGHAQVMENLGFSKHKDFLERFSQRMLGLHLHNLIGCNDHLAPVKGDLDFSLLKPYIKKGTLLIIEAHYPASTEELIKSRKLLKDIFYA